MDSPSLVILLPLQTSGPLHRPPGSRPGLTLHSRTHSSTPQGRVSSHLSPSISTLCAPGDRGHFLKFPSQAHSLQVSKHCLSSPSWELRLHSSLHPACPQPPPQHYSTASCPYCELIQGSGPLHRQTPYPLVSHAPHTPRGAQRKEHSPHSVTRVRSCLSHPGSWDSSHRLQL